MKNTISIFILLLFSFNIFAQQGLFQVSPYRLTTGKKVSYYKKATEKNAKNNNLRPASLNAIQWVQLETKKKRKEKAQEQLASLLPQCLERSTTKANTIKSSTASFNGEATVTQLANLKALYQELEAIRVAHAAMSSDLQVAGLSFPTSYEPEIKQADEKLQEARSQAAEMLYQEAIKMENADTRLLRTDYLQIAKKYKRISRYAMNYKDTETRHADIKEQATIYLAISPIINNTRYSGNTTSTARTYLIQAINKELAKGQHLYVEVLPENQFENSKANVRLEMTFSNAAPFKEYREPESKTKQKKAEGESEEVYSGTLTKYFKESYVKQTVNYRLIDLQTGEVIASDAKDLQDTVWTELWYKFTGDKRALKKSERKALEREGKEEPWPSDSNLVQRMFNSSRITNAMSSIIMDLANKEGK